MAGDARSPLHRPLHRRGLHRRRDAEERVRSVPFRDGRGGRDARRQHLYLPGTVCDGRAAGGNLRRGRSAHRGWPDHPIGPPVRSRPPCRGRHLFLRISLYHVHLHRPVRALRLSKFARDGAGHPNGVCASTLLRRGHRNVRRQPDWGRNEHVGEEDRCLGGGEGYRGVVQGVHEGQ